MRKWRAYGALLVALTSLGSCSAWGSLTECARALRIGEVKLQALGLSEVSRVRSALGLRIAESTWKDLILPALEKGENVGTLLIDTKKDNALIGVGIWIRTYRGIQILDFWVSGEAITQELDYFLASEILHSIPERGVAEMVIPVTDVTTAKLLLRLHFREVDRACVFSPPNYGSFAERVFAIGGFFALEPYPQNVPE